MLFTTKKLILAGAILGGLAVSSAALADGETNKLNNNSYQQYAAIDCFSSPCVLAFPPTTYQTTVVTAVSCSAAVGQGSGQGAVLGIALGITDSNVRFYLQSFVYQSLDGNVVLLDAVNAATNMFVNKGGAPYVQANATGNGILVGPLTCTISGYHS